MSSSTGQKVLPSSLQSIQNMTSQLLGDSGKINSSSSAPPPSRHSAHRQTATTCGSSQSSDVSEASDTQPSGEYKWPGIDAVMMAYHKHLQGMPCLLCGLMLARCGDANQQLIYIIQQSIFYMFTGVAL